MMYNCYDTTRDRFVVTEIYQYDKFNRPKRRPLAVETLSEVIDGIDFYIKSLWDVRKENFKRHEMVIVPFVGGTYDFKNPIWIGDEDSVAHLYDLMEADKSCPNPYSLEKLRFTIDSLTVIQRYLTTSPNCVMGVDLAVSPEKDVTVSTYCEVK